jgi:hypothetical protein
MSVYGRDKEEARFHLKSNIDGVKQRTLKLRANNEQAIPIEIDENGVIHARGFVDENDHYELFLREGKLFYKKQDGVGFDRLVDVSLGTTTYRASVGASAKIVDAFYHLESPITAGVRVLAGYPMSHGDSKNEVNELFNIILSTDDRFLSPDKSNEAYNHASLYKSVSFKPLNYDVCIKAQKEVSNMQDLLVVKTGEWQYANAGGLWSGVKSGLKQEKIVFVTPHEILRESGSTINTGVLMTGVKSMAGSVTGITVPTYSGASRLMPEIVHTGINVISSRNYIFESGKMLSGGMTATRRTELYSGYTGGDFTQHSGILLQALSGYVNTGVVWETHTQNYPFYKEYSGRAKRTKRVISGYNEYGRALYNGKTTGYLKDNFATSYNWDGVIPAGTPFKIEYWSTNGRTLGHDGAFQVVPVNWGSGIEANVTGSAVGRSKVSYEYASADAGRRAQGSIFNSLKALYVLNGIINSGSNFKSWNNFKNGIAGFQKENKYGDATFQSAWTGVHGDAINNFSTGAAYQ